MVTLDTLTLAPNSILTFSGDKKAPKNTSTKVSKCVVKSGSSIMVVDLSAQIQFTTTNDTGHANKLNKTELFANTPLTIDQDAGKVDIIMYPGSVINFKDNMTLSDLSLESIPPIGQTSDPIDAL